MSSQLFSNPGKAPKRHFGGVGSVSEGFIHKGRSCNTSFKRFLNPYNFGKTVLNYCHPYFQVTPKCKTIKALKTIALQLYPTTEHYTILSKPNHSIRYEKIWEMGTFLPILLFRKIMKSSTATKSFRRVILHLTL